ncbi:MAG: amylo-alpha-1,6-glucosidase [Planctomycetota bacterium]
MKSDDHAAPHAVTGEPGPEAEWLETDGRGGFASGTVRGVRTRRYHGLLIAWPAGLTRRHLFVAGLRADLLLEGGPAGAWPGQAPIRGFRLSPHPVWELATSEGPLQVEVLSGRGAPVTLVRWTLAAGSRPCRLRVRPALACREADALHFRNDALDPAVTPVPGGFRARPYPSLPEVTIAFDRGDSDGEAELEPHPAWVQGIDLIEERRRGYDAVEDEFEPGSLTVALHPGRPRTLALCIGEAPTDPDQAFETARAARQIVSAEADLPTRLAARADDFLQEAPSMGARPRLGICAGFPWFTEWGRDTFLSLPGLTIARGRLDLATRVLTEALPFLQDGLLPNVYATTKDSSHYGSVDAALWYARAVDLWRAAGGSDALYRDVLGPALLEIASGYAEGKGAAGRLGLRARPDGLLTAGRPDLNATWMDAQLPEGPVTPRDGMPVEIEALWIALLDQCVALRPSDARLRAMRDRSFEAFVALFWIPGSHGGPGRLADRIDADGQQDRRIRPNMVLAAALARSPLHPAQKADVFATATEHLRTPRGLRTLAPNDPDFVPRYEGDQRSRDLAYHQGTVWPWLLGAYVELGLQVDGPGARADLHGLLEGFGPELDRAGLGHISEVYDGDPPHRPGGTIAQAWSTAELLRALALVEAGAQKEDSA